MATFAYCLPDMVMNSRELVAYNLNQMMKDSLDLNTQPKLHAKTGLSQSTISRTLKAETSIGVDALESLAAAFKCDIADFFVLNKSSDLENTESEKATPNFEDLSREELIELIKLSADLLSSS